MTHTPRAAVIGASGYSGVELTKLLLRHRGVRLTRLFAHASVGQSIAELHPWFAGRLDLMLEAYIPGMDIDTDIVFVALPSGPALEIVPELLARGTRVIDLGGDFRLKDQEAYEAYYERSPAPVEVLSEAVYGIPEWSRTAIRRADLLANPGCYPTSATLPLAPLLNEGLIEPHDISITSMSGVSGAGRKGGLELAFCEVNETVKAYRVGTHQHVPEIRATLEAITGQDVSFTFVPHLIPITRGIYTTTTAPLRPGVAAGDVIDAFQRAYGAEPFVRFSPSEVPEIRNVLHTNYIDIGFRIMPDQGRIILMSAIDNLMKGAAGQAVHNMNIMFELNETEGLI